MLLRTWAQEFEQARTTKADKSESETGDNSTNLVANLLIATPRDAAAAGQRVETGRRGRAADPDGECRVCGRRRRCPWATSLPSW